MPVNLTGAPIKALTSTYWLARKFGLLETYWGQSIFAASYFVYKRYLEDPFCHLIRRHPELFVGGNVLDIGANIGYTALLFSHAIDPGCRVYAFEPEEFNYKLLERTAGSRRAQGRIVPIRGAVGDRDGITELWQNEHHHADHRIMTDEFRASAIESRSIAVPMVKIDTFVQKQDCDFPVRFIKVDVQGYEFPVCKGMEQTLRNNPRALVALEYMPEAMHQLGFQAIELITWLCERGYRAYSIDKDGSLGADADKRLPERGYVDLLFSREDVQASSRR